MLKEQLGTFPLHDTEVQLWRNPSGEMQAHNGQVACSGQRTLSKNWLLELWLNWSEIKKVSTFQVFWNVEPSRTEIRRPDPCCMHQDVKIQVRTLGRCD